MNNKSNKKSGTMRRLTLSAVMAIVFVFSLGITTYALFYATVFVEDNYFQTGIVKINLNNGNPVIEELEYLFEPGMTVEKPFFIESQSTCDVYYKIYLGEVAGGLADILEITVLDEDGGEICKGTASSLTRQNVIAADKALNIGERRDLKIRFHYPEDSGNASQDSYLQFVLCADAVQVKNNPDKDFGNSD